jgi:uncharacterized protein (TIGR00299 family) protein
MKILRFDSVGGASGDMILGALVGLGVDIGKLKSDVASLGIEDFTFETAEHSEYGLSGSRLTVNINNPPEQHRHLNDIRDLITKSNISDNAKATAIKTFTLLAEAEAEIHGVQPEEVHFHEVGALDSIIDIVGSCIAMDMLGVDEILVGPLPLGSGTVECMHGTIPVPSPATLALIKQHPVIQTDEPFELVTPTGAALLMSLCEPAVNSAQASVVSGPSYSFGHTTLKNRPNLLRATILDTSDAAATDECLVLECNIDDTVPELIGSLSTELLKKGALDVFTTPIQMKKQRPGTLLSVLCKPVDRETFLETIFNECTTFGVREHLTHRTILDRRHVEVETPYGKVRIKTGSRKGRDITSAPEHDDCVKCAEEHGVPVRTVYESALKAIA